MFTEEQIKEEAYKIWTQNNTNDQLHNYYLAEKRLHFKHLMKDLHPLIEKIQNELKTKYLSQPKCIGNPTKEHLTIIKRSCEIEYLSSYIFKKTHQIITFIIWNETNQSINKIKTYKENENIDHKSLEQKLWNIMPSNIHDLHKTIPYIAEAETLYYSLHTNGFEIEKTTNENGISEYYINHNKPIYPHKTQK